MQKSVTFSILALLFLPVATTFAQEKTVESQIQSMQKTIDRLNRELNQLKTSQAQTSDTKPNTSSSRSVLVDGARTGNNSSSSANLVPSNNATIESLPRTESLPIQQPFQSTPTLAAPQAVVPQFQTQPLQQLQYPQPIQPPRIVHTLPQVATVPQSTATFQSPIIGGQVFTSVPHWYGPGIEYFHPQPQFFPQQFINPPFVQGPRGNGIYLGGGGWGLDVGGVQMHFRGGNPWRGRGFRRGDDDDDD